MCVLPVFQETRSEVRDKHCLWLCEYTKCPVLSAETSHFYSVYGVAYFNATSVNIDGSVQGLKVVKSSCTNMLLTFAI